MERSQVRILSPPRRCSSADRALNPDAHPIHLHHYDFRRGSTVVRLSANTECEFESRQFLGNELLYAPSTGKGQPDQHPLIYVADRRFSRPNVPGKWGVITLGDRAERKIDRCWPAVGRAAPAGRTCSTPIDLGLTVHTTALHTPLDRSGLRITPTPRSSKNSHQLPSALRVHGRIGYPCAQAFGRM